MPTTDTLFRVAVTLLVGVLDLGALYLVSQGKIEWNAAKDLIVWTLGPFLVANAVENSTRHVLDARAKKSEETNKLLGQALSGIGAVLGKAAQDGAPTPEIKPDESKDKPS